MYKGKNGFPKNISLRILCYSEGKKIVAHALEMDLKGYGKTRQEAERELKDLIQMQLSFAKFKKDPSLIFYPAEASCFIIYERVRDQYLKNMQQNNDYFIDDFPLSQINFNRHICYEQNM